MQEPRLTHCDCIWINGYRRAAKDRPKAKDGSNGTVAPVARLVTMEVEFHYHDRNVDSKLQACSTTV